jgi:hypothetical protein
MDILTAKIDRGCYKRIATDSFKRVHSESPRYTRATPGNQLVDNNMWVLHIANVTRTTGHYHINIQGKVQIHGLDSWMMP